MQKFSPARDIRHDTGESTTKKHNKSSWVVESVTITSLYAIKVQFCVVRVPPGFTVAAVQRLYPFFAYADPILTDLES